MLQIDWLVGHALLGEGGEAVRRLSPYDLPLPPAQRFQFLFKIKPRWRKEELEPYVALSNSPSRVCPIALTLTAVTFAIFPPRSTKFSSSTRVSLGCRDHRVSSSGTQKGSSSLQWCGYLRRKIRQERSSMAAAKCAKCSRVDAEGTWDPGHKAANASAAWWQFRSQRVYFELQCPQALVE
jgi:hypothetical protein